LKRVKRFKASTARFIPAQGKSLDIAEQIPTDTTKALLLGYQSDAFSHKEFARRQLESHKMKSL